MKKREKIALEAKKVIAECSEGIRYANLVRRLKDVFPDELDGNFRGAIWNLDTRFPEEIYKPSRGVFRHVKFREEEIPLTTELPKESGKIREESFYQPFADWLLDLEECTEAIPLGGSKFKDKWSTPDVIGVFKCRESDIIKLPMEVVVAEVKTDSNRLIEALVQACAYKLFTHKSYLVIPKESQQEDVARLDSLCIICGIGLILFDLTNPTSPDFQIRVRAARHEPDSFYTNRYLKLAADDLQL